MPPVDWTAIDLKRRHALGNGRRKGIYRVFESDLGTRHPFVHRANPVYTRPGSEELIRRAGMVVYCARRSLKRPPLPTGSSRAADLESWGDYEPYNGVYSLLQPTMTPIQPTRSTGDIFLNLASAAGKPLGRDSGGPEVVSAQDWVQLRWRSLNPDRTRPDVGTGAPPWSRADRPRSPSSQTLIPASIRIQTPPAQLNPVLSAYDFRTARIPSERFSGGGGKIQEDVPR